MSEDWQAVARAINERLTALGLSQRELIERSQVSEATVREIQNNTAQRRRSDRTLEALSTALDLHPGHLAAVLAGQRPAKLGEPIVRSEGDVPGRLLAIEHQLRELRDQMTAMDRRLDEITNSVDSVARHIFESHEDSGR